MSGLRKAVVRELQVGLRSVRIHKRPAVIDSYERQWARHLVKLFLLEKDRHPRQSEAARLGPPQHRQVLRLGLITCSLGRGDTGSHTLGSPEDHPAEPFRERIVLQDLIASLKPSIAN